MYGSSTNNAINDSTVTGTSFICNKKWHGQIYPAQQNAKDITLLSLKITVKSLTVFQELLITC